MIGIFKTNINTQREKNQVIRALSGEFSATMCTLDVVYCDTGRRSSAAAYILVERGFDAYVLTGGLTNSNIALRRAV